VPVEPRSFADGLNAPFAGTTCLEVCRELVDTVVLVSDEEIRDGFRFLYERAKLACEPAGAAATAALIAGKVALERGDRVAVIVSGGNVDPRIASDTLAAR
jgi:threonine dehydratase